MTAKEKKEKENKTRSARTKLSTDATTMDDSMNDKTNGVIMTGLNQTLLKNTMCLEIYLPRRGQPGSQGQGQGHGLVKADVALAAWPRENKISNNNEHCTLYSSRVIASLKSSTDTEKNRHTNRQRADGEKNRLKQ